MQISLSPADSGLCDVMLLTGGLTLWFLDKKMSFEASLYAVAFMGLPTSFMQEKMYINFICASNYVFIIIKKFYKYFNISHFKQTCLYYNILIYFIYREIRKSLREFRPLRYCSRNFHAEGEHVNRGRGTPIFCPHRFSICPPLVTRQMSIL